MKLIVHTHDVSTIVVDGPWVCGDTPGDDLRTRVRELIERGQIELTLDLSGVPMVDSTGIGAIASAHIALQKRGGRLILRDPAPRVERLLEVSRLSSVIEVRRTGESPSTHRPKSGEVVRTVDPSTCVPIWTVAS